MNKTASSTDSKSSQESTERLAHFNEVLRRSSSMAGRDLVEWLRGLTAGGATATAIYQTITNEARPLALAVYQAKKKGVGVMIEVGGVRRIKMDAEVRLRVLRLVQEAALKDAVGEDKAKAAAYEVAEVARKAAKAARR